MRTRELVCGSQCRGRVEPRREAFVASSRTPSQAAESWPRPADGPVQRLKDRPNLRGT